MQTPEKKPFKALLKHLSKWWVIGTLFLGCWGATWKFLESTEYAAFVIAGGFAICAFLTLYRLFRRKKNRWLKYGMPALSVPLFAFFCVGVSIITNREWQPPKLPQGCTKVAVKFGSDTFEFPLKMLWLTRDNAISKVDGKYLRFAEIELKMGNRIYEHPIRPEIKRNRFYVSVTIPHEKERKLISMDNALDRHLPPNWDRNFSTNAFEIVREDSTPVLQVIYRRADVIEVYGVFMLDRNHVFVTFGPTNSLWLQNLTADNTNVTVDSSFEILSTTAFQADFVKRKPLFKYPSYKYPGVYAE
jgi:hypothetical protein